MMRRRPFATVVVGSSTLLREGLVRILGAADFRIVASATRIDERVLSLLPQHQSVLLIIDACDDHDAAIEQVEYFKKQHPAGRVAMLADHYQLSDIVLAYRAGVNVYFAKVATCDTFIKSLELVMLGETILPMAILSFIFDNEVEAITSDLENNAEFLAAPDRNDAPNLSPQERCILGHLIQGDSNKGIARKIRIAEATVKVHVKAILRKIRAHNRTQAAIWAMNHDPSLRVRHDGPAAPTEQIHDTSAPAACAATDNSDWGATPSTSITPPIQGACHVGSRSDRANTHRSGRRAERSRGSA